MRNRRRPVQRQMYQYSVTHRVSEHPSLRKVISKFPRVQLPSTSLLLNALLMNPSQRICHLQCHGSHAYSQMLGRSTCNRQIPTHRMDSRTTGALFARTWNWNHRVVTRALKILVRCSHHILHRNESMSQELRKDKVLCMIWSTNMVEDCLQRKENQIHYFLKHPELVIMP